MKPSWRLRYEIRIDEPYLLLNRWQRMHWASRRRYHERLAWLIRKAVGKNQPARPLDRCWIHVTRGNPLPLPDTDGLYGGLKPLLDCLVQRTARNPLGLGLIRDDNSSVIEQLEAVAVKAPRKEGYTVIRIYSPNSGKEVKAA